MANIKQLCVYKELTQPFETYISIPFFSGSFSLFQFSNMRQTELWIFLQVKRCINQSGAWYLSQFTVSKIIIFLNKGKLLMMQSFLLTVNWERCYMVIYIIGFQINIGKWWRLIKYSFILISDPRSFKYRIHSHIYPGKKCGSSSDRCS